MYSEPCCTTYYNYFEFHEHSKKEVKWTENEI